ncbi:MAG: radical SAM protein, partial [Alphaproteobacteria bacterium]|nr:radical SAM protein [Alphaproteobacteria bacterium]
SGSVRIEGVHPLQFGFLRRKRRRERRHGLPLESPLVFYPRRLGELALTLWRWVRLMRRYRRILARVLADPAPATYTDDALRTEASESGFVQIFSEKIPRTYGAPKARSAAV